MAAKMGPVRLPTYPKSARSGKVRDVALALGVGEASAQKALYGEHSRARDTARILEALIRRGDVAMAGELFAIVEAPMLGGVVPPLEVAKREHAIADEREDLHRVECGADLTDAELAERIRLVAAENYRSSILLAALRREQEERKERAR